MAQINLLPWRDERRQEMQQEFMIILGMVAALGGVLILLGDFFFNGQIDNQKSRNAYLEKNIEILNREVAEIQDLQRKRTQLLDRMQVISELQGNRPIIVRILDQVVRTVPDGIFYTSLEAKGSTISIQGISESNNRVSSLMRRLDSSAWFSEPNLMGVKSEPLFGNQANNFQMNFKVKAPTAGQEEE
jgi:type IV pilus assembly protein PilN